MTDRRSSAATCRIFSDCRSCGASTSDCVWRWRRSWLNPPLLIGCEACLASWRRWTGCGTQGNGRLNLADLKEVAQVGAELLVRGPVAVAVKVELEVV